MVKSPLHRPGTRRGVLLGAGLLASGCAADQTAAVMDALFGLGATGALTQAEAAEGVRAALNQGVVIAVANVSRPGGYFNDPQVRIPLPQSLETARSRLDLLGLAGPLDELEREINAGAEAAAPAARDIIGRAIGELTIEDALGIVSGGDTAATDYLDEKTRSALAGAFRGPLRGALDTTGAFKTLDSISASMERASPLGPRLGERARVELVDFGVDKALDGLFYYIAQEEAAIRENPAKRASRILQRVFGAAA